MPPTESSSVVDHNSTKKIQDMSLYSASTHDMPPAGSLSVVDNNSMKTLQSMSLSSSPTTHAMILTESSSAVLPETDDSLYVLVKRKTDEDVEQDLAPENNKRIKRDLQQNTGTESKPSKAVGLMDLPSELRLNILSHALNSAAGPSGTISVNPRAKVSSDPSGVFHAHVDSDLKDQTKWQVRRGLLQTCHKLREEALEVLYNENTFYARVTDFYRQVNFEKQRFSRWLKAMGGDSEICRVRKVTFGVEWASLEDNLGWTRRKGDVCVSIIKGKATVEGTGRIAECPGEPLEEIDGLVTMFLAGKAAGEGLDYAQWMLLWYEIQCLTSGWGTHTYS